MSTQPIQKKFQEAFDSFLEKIKQDPKIIGVYVFGSLARGDMWEGSDLDVVAITSDEKSSRDVFVLIENGVVFHCDVISRSYFRRSHERMLRGSIPHQMFTTGKLVYATDDSIQDYYQDLAVVGDRDREMLACYYGTAVIGYRHSVRKSLLAHKDPLYMFIWLLEDIRYMANIEVVLRGETIQRESLHQAVQLNPEVFEPMVSRLLQGPKDLDSLHEILGVIEAYMEENARKIFSPILSYLQNEGDFRGISEIYERLAPRLQMRETSMQLMDTCNWLVEVGILQEVTNPIKLTSKSRATVDEPAYYYDGEQE
jgi:predicted nucleotidyltransferase